MVDVVSLARDVDDACSLARVVVIGRGELVQPLGRLSDNISNMMMRHRRWPAILVLVAMVGIGAAVARGGRDRGGVGRASRNWRSRLGGGRAGGDVGDVCRS